MAEELDGCGHNVVVRNRKEGGLGVHRDIPYEFAVTLIYIYYYIYIKNIIIRKIKISFFSIILT